VINRAQRRLAASKRGKKKGLAQAGIQLDAAMAALRGAGGLEEATKAMVTAQKQMAETQSILEAMVEDNQTMSDQMEALEAELVTQRAVTILLIQGALSQYSGSGVGVSKDTIKQLEEKLRAEVQKAAEESSCEGT